MVVASSCFVGGFLISALGCYTGQFWLVVLGYGFVGGIGLGIGYISPVSTLIKWFPDRPGLATGIAIMGFGGGALIASPLTTPAARRVRRHRQGRDGGGRRADVPRDGHPLRGLHVGRVAARPGARRTGGGPRAGRRPPTRRAGRHGDVSARNAIRTPQFWLLWVVLCFNVTAGIGILERAAPI